MDAPSRPAALILGSCFFSVLDQNVFEITEKN